ncbi:MAG: AzlC family ABC transporter permease [Eubacteriales bacterium]|nr:AzlC family ABC transporter permease [Eubacteriales bacterium]
MTRKQLFSLAFTKSLPILCSYLFLSLAYGLMMQNAGFAWYYSLFASAAVYTGAFQFVLITFLSSGASLVTVALTALLMNSRQVFYALTFLPDFSKTGKQLPYMIHSLTDETFAVNCTLTLTGREKRDAMFYLAILSQSYWVIGSVIGGVLGQLIPFDFEGIDFCMTALFLIIFVDQWEKASRAAKTQSAKPTAAQTASSSAEPTATQTTVSNAKPTAAQTTDAEPATAQTAASVGEGSNFLLSHLPALLGLSVGLLCLLVFGESSFMLPALLITSALLLLWQHRSPMQPRRAA